MKKYTKYIIALALLISVSSIYADVDTFTWTPNQQLIRVGSHGDQVRQLQQCLSILGDNPNSNIDGEFGPITKRAVISFQTKKELKIDGIIGNETGPKYTEVCSQLDIPITWTSDIFNRKISSECKVLSGCNGPIHCVDISVDAGNFNTTCESLPEYACYKNAGNICAKQSSGYCGWEDTPELLSCKIQSNEYEINSNIGSINMCTDGDETIYVINSTVTDVGSTYIADNEEIYCNWSLGQPEDSRCNDFGSFNSCEWIYASENNINGIDPIVDAEALDRIDQYLD